MKLLDGRIIKKEMMDSLKNKLSDINKKISFVVIQIGDDKACDIYIRSKKKMALDLGIECIVNKLESDVNTEEVINIINMYNSDDNISGIMVELPIPSHLDYELIRNTIDPEKDVDGVTDVNIGKLVTGRDGIISCTASSVMKILSYYDISLVGKNVVVVGRSNLVGKPLFNLLVNCDATVTVCHSKTSNLSFYTRNADILIVCVGKANFITRDMVKDDAIVIDVGTNVIDGKLCGDVNFNDVESKVGYITPVPGGVGQITSLILAENIYKCYRNKKI